MPRGNAANMALGATLPDEVERAYYWRAPANSVTTPLTINLGSCCVIDGFEAGKATLVSSSGTSSQRTAVGGAPHYDLQAGDNSYSANMICPDTVAHARDRMGVLLDATATAGDGIAHKWKVSGQVQALVSITTALSQQLTIDESVANSRAGTLRAAVAGERVMAIAREIVVGTATAPVLCLVELVGGHGYNLNA